MRNNSERAKTRRELRRNSAVIEEEFFPLDRQTRAATFRLTYKSPDEIVDPNHATTQPMLTQDFLLTMEEAFDLIPEKYKVKIDVAFDDLAGWDPAELSDICRCNLLLRTKMYYQKARSHNLLAGCMCIVSLFFIILSALLSRVWNDGGFLNSVVFFFLDIVATVPFWCATEIYFVDNKEHRRRAAGLVRRYEMTVFHQKEQTRE